MRAGRIAAAIALACALAQTPAWSAAAQNDGCAPVTMRADWHMDLLWPAGVERVPLRYMLTIPHAQYTTGDLRAGYTSGLPWIEVSVRNLPVTEAVHLPLEPFPVKVLDATGAVLDDFDSGVSAPADPFDGVRAEMGGLSDPRLLIPPGGVVTWVVAVAPLRSFGVPWPDGWYTVVVTIPSLAFGDSMAPVLVARFELVDGQARPCAGRHDANPAVAHR